MADADWGWKKRSDPTNDKESEAETEVSSEEEEETVQAAPLAAAANDGMDKR